MADQPTRPEDSAEPGTSGGADHETGANDDAGRPPAAGEGVEPAIPADAGGEAPRTPFRSRLDPWLVWIGAAGAIAAIWTAALGPTDEFGIAILFRLALTSIILGLSLGALGRGWAALGSSAIGVLIGLGLVALGVGAAVIVIVIELAVFGLPAYGLVRLIASAIRSRSTNPSDESPTGPSVGRLTAAGFATGLALILIAGTARPFYAEPGWSVLAIVLLVASGLAAGALTAGWASRATIVAWLLAGWGVGLRLMMADAEANTAHIATDPRTTWLVKAGVALGLGVILFVVAMIAARPIAARSLGRWRTGPGESTVAGPRSGAPDPRPAIVIGLGLAIVAGIAAVGGVGEAGIPVVHVRFTDGTMTVEPAAISGPEAVIVIEASPPFPEPELTTAGPLPDGGVELIRSGQDPGVATTSWSLPSAGSATITYRDTVYPGTYAWWVGPSAVDTLEVSR
jgi:hypothetical protein